MGPALPPVTCGSSLTKTPAQKVHIECFIDLICPFSNKLFTTLSESVLPKLDGDISVTIHQVIQPWHPQGTMVHETAFAVKQVSPESYAAYIKAVYGAFAEGKFKDEDTWNKTRLQIYDDLLELVPDGVDKAAIKALLMPSGTGGNEGNAITQEIKWACKYHRTRGVHVTPTVFVNGLEAGVVSSSWSADDWSKFLAAKGQDYFRFAS